MIDECPFCGLPKEFWAPLYIVSDIVELRYSMCQCGYIFATNYNVDTEEYYKEQYHKDVSMKYGKEQTDSVEPLVMLNEYKRAENLMPLIERFMVSSALDFGSSSGVLLNEIKLKYNCPVQGVELSQNYREYSNRNGIPCVSDINLLTETYHLITCIHVLEHAPDPSKILTGLKEHGTKDSIYLFQVPFFSPGAFHPVLYNNNVFATVLQRYGFALVNQKFDPNNLTFICMLR
jgi:hypothetical protein